MRWTALLVAVPLAGGCKSAPGPVRGDDGVPREVAGPSPGAHGAREIVTFPSGTLTLHGVVYRPKREGASPAVLWNHGSYKEPMVAFDELGPAFAAHGWVFFGPFRRGQGLSADAGPYIDDEIDRANREGGSDAGARTMVRLLAGEHLDDQLAAYDWLRTRTSAICCCARCERAGLPSSSFRRPTTSISLPATPWRRRRETL